jgi:hypothetical protein
VPEGNTQKANTSKDFVMREDERENSDWELFFPFRTRNAS